MPKHHHRAKPDRPTSPTYQSQDRSGPKKELSKQLAASDAQHHQRGYITDPVQTTETENAVRKHWNVELNEDENVMSNAIRGNADAHFGNRTYQTADTLAKQY